MKVVGKYTTSFAANIAKGRLESAGIQSCILNENILFVTGVTNDDLLSIELAVSDQDYLEAKRLLAADSSAK